jgi:hypothetical protein
MLPFHDLHSMIASDRANEYLNFVYFCVLKVFLKEIKKLMSKIIFKK